jgi:acetate kinase
VNGQIVVVNAGSATVKFAGYEISGDPIDLELGFRGLLEQAPEGIRFHVVDGKNSVVKDDASATGSRQLADIPSLIDQALQWIKTFNDNPIVAFGHRVVHGGDSFSASIPLNDAVVAKLETYIPLAPLHQPFNLAAISAIQKSWPNVLQAACFDTAFHQTQPRIARMFGLPSEYFDKGIKRYGFHGLSYEYIAGVLPEYLGDAADGKVIVAHLGSGASLCAMSRRESIATTMGFTALDGLLMGTRCGAIDPGVILYLINEEELDSEQLTGLLYRHSGLLGVSGLSADMRELLASDTRGAAEAIELFVYAAVRQIGGLIAVLGGLDALVFTGGIGAHSAPVRQHICEQSAWAGISMDQQKNHGNGPRISADGSPVSVWAIPTDEEEIIASHTFELLTKLQNP